MNLREPYWGFCAECGAATASVLMGPTVCFECSGKSDRAAEASAEFASTCPESFAWASFEAPELAVRTTSEARRKAAQAVSAAKVALTGPSGSGKTSLGVAMARRWASLNGWAPVIVSGVRLGAARMRGHGEGEINSALYAPLLLLDDLGSERDVPSSPISEVIHERHANSRPTWVTTWMGADAVTVRYGAGIARRVFEGAIVIDCGAP